MVTLSRGRCDLTKIGMSEQFSERALWAVSPIGHTRHAKTQDNEYESIPNV